MEFKGMAWVGYRTMDYEQVVKIFLDLLEMDAAEVGEDYTLFRFSGGDELEVMKISGNEQISGTWQQGPVPGLEVDSMAAGISRIRDAGLRITSPLQYGNDGSCWVHFLLPDGSEWELKQWDCRESHTTG